MNYIMVNIETDGPVPEQYSMVCLSAIVVDEKLDKKFTGFLKPITHKYQTSGIKTTQFDRKETLDFDEAQEVMVSFRDWIESHKGRPVFIAKNNGFCWQFINYYFYYFLGYNPFGSESYHLDSLFKGMGKGFKKNYRHLISVSHKRHCYDSVIDHAKILLAMKLYGFDQ